MRTVPYDTVAEVVAAELVIDEVHVLAAVDAGLGDLTRDDVRSWADVLGFASRSRAHSDGYWLGGGNAV